MESGPQRLKRLRRGLYAPAFARSGSFQTQSSGSCLYCSIDSQSAAWGDAPRGEKSASRRGAFPARPAFRSPPISVGELRKLLYQRPRIGAGEGRSFAENLPNSPRRGYGIESVFSYARTAQRVVECSPQRRREKPLTFATRSSPAGKGALLELTDADGQPFSSLTTASCWTLPQHTALPQQPRKRSPVREEPPRKIPFFVPQSPPVQGGAFRGSHRRCGSIQHFDIDQTTRLKKFAREPC